MRRASILLLLAAAVAGALLGPWSDPSADATAEVMPGSFTGYAFDACQAPSQQQMDVWRRHSPYRAVGVYVSGANRACAEQRHLDRAWVAEQDRLGWLLLPLHVGRQASCAGVARWRLVSADPADGYAAAADQGREEADTAVAAARDLGIATGSTLWYDLEGFDTRGRQCRDSTVAMLAGWTGRLHDHGFRSGVYSSASSGIAVLERRRRAGAGGLPDRVWVADWNGREDVHSPVLAADAWAGDRVHQFRGTHTESYGGVPLVVDSNFLVTGGGTRAGRAAPAAATTPLLKFGSGGPAVRRLQRALNAAGPARLRVTGTFLAPTRDAVRALQRRRGLPATGVVTGRLWRQLQEDRR
ncbi:glycoside hydrolase domain-containing protein [Nocardioides mesophilus]|uniref:DUF1906 domain-containing protein n=1 Tax=Nocardioides mesophilus TaxID=433659 RepID=A0A7G9RF04_9ACTN|nr:glycoside hydrolase domain-containing protein [Nocardioides mesophilus]QNN54179.1 DUF1906 domain-containing protein [Nocardioides mesophilus]